jgi:ketosteroid isomerase-like protein
LPVFFRRVDPPEPRARISGTLANHRRTRVNHVETVRSIYSAFGRQDVPAILEHLAPDVAWDYAYRDEGIPWLAPRHGREGVVQFLQSLAGLQLTKFEVRAVIGDADLVVALVDVEGTVVATGKRIAEPNEVHLWHFNAGGQVQRFRHAVDTLQHWRACQP